jgi:AAA family ATP:ADP antiporter
VLLFTNFFLIVAAYYRLKPASRSIFITALGADQLPYVWIATAVSLGLTRKSHQANGRDWKTGFVNHPIVARNARIHVVLGTCTTIITLLLVFFPGMREPGQRAVWRRVAREFCLLALGQAHGAGNRGPAAGRGRHPCWR